MPELIRLPKLVLQAASIRVTIREDTSHLGLPTSWAGMLKRHAFGRYRTTVLNAEVPLIDLRFDGAKNFAHVFCWTGLLALAAKRALREQTGDDRLIVVVSGDAKGFVLRALEFLGLTPFPTFGPVRGRIVAVSESGHSPLLRLASDLLQPLPVVLLESGPVPPKKLFISRRDVRCIENEAEILPILERRGFIRIYAEDLSVPEQIRHVTNATHVVAIHGAALGPLLCRAVMHNRSPLRLVELFGSGYIVTLYRQVASNLGDSWIAVRGRTTPDVVRDTDFAEVARAHEKSNFTLDQEALCIALDASDQSVDPEFSVTW